MAMPANWIRIFAKRLKRNFTMKKRIRKTGEIVDVISYNKYTTTKRNSELDWVSYIDSKGIEHEHEKRLNIYWDFEDVEEVPNKDVDWEQYRREIAKTMLHAIYLDDGNAERADKSGLGFEYKDLQSSAKEAVRFADALISVLKKGGEK